LYVRSYSARRTLANGSRSQAEKKRGWIAHWTRQ
jgi:hypothetical protein